MMAAALGALIMLQGCGGQDGGGQRAYPVVDSHIHLAVKIPGRLDNKFIFDMDNEAFAREWPEDYYVSQAKKGGSWEVRQAVFVQVFNTPAIEEARWILEKVDNESSVVAGLIAEIDVQAGGGVVNAFLDQLRDSQGALPRGLKGARKVFVLPPYNNDSAATIRSDTFKDGLRVMGENNLIWEWAVHPDMLPAVHDTCKEMENVTFVLDHLGLNDNPANDNEPFEEWKDEVTKLAKLSNFHVKMGAIEEWNVANPKKYMEYAIDAFGFDHIMYESNWFFSEALGDSYDRVGNMLHEALSGKGATPEDIEKVFSLNARNLYSLPQDNRMFM